MARPTKYNVKKITKALTKYIAEHSKTADYPILTEFCLLNHINRTYIYTLGEKSKALMDAIKACHDAKELGLERGAAHGDIPPAFAIFSLKQLGWTDKQEIEHSGLPTPPSTLTINLVEPPNAPNQ